MLRRSAYLLAGFVSQGVVFAVCLVSRGAGWTVGIVAVGAERTAGLVLRGVDRTTNLSSGARDTLVRLWDGAGVGQAAAVVAGLPGNTSGRIRTYVRRLQSVSRCRTSYCRVTRPLGARYRELRKIRLRT